MKLSIAAAIISICLLAGPQARAAFDLTTSFEFTDITGSFTLGTPPKSVTFLNGKSESVGIFPLYHSGLKAWVIDPAQTGEILFETSASVVDLWLRDQTPTHSLLTFYDSTNQVLAQFNGLDIAFQHIVVDTVGPIARITLQNNGATGLVVIDDFSFTAIPSPGGIAVMGLAGLGLIRRRRH